MSIFYSRTVAVEEAQNLCLLYNCQFYEVSAAESVSGVHLAFQSLLKEARSASLQRSLPIRRKIGVNSVSKALGNIFGKNNKSDRKRPSLSIWEGIFVSKMIPSFWRNYSNVTDLVLNSVMQLKLEKVEMETQNPINLFQLFLKHTIWVL